MTFDRIELTTDLLHKSKCCYECFFLLSHFLAVADYELSKSTSHLLSVALTLECVRILS